MPVVYTIDGKPVQVEVKRILEHQLKQFTKVVYFFRWTEERNFLVFGLSLKDSGEIIGLMSLEPIASEWRIHVRLIAVSKENLGKGKQLSGIAGILLAFAAKMALRDFGELACISLRPKTALINHYKTQYGMRQTGLTLSLEIPELIYLINQYYHEHKQ
ncbi:MAG: N-acetyltransferase [Sphingobacteriaceae bacterium]|nr:N-acetyltransferase [Sphingobacteriaceae bacterium]